ncbi:hypothetical protein Pcinc_014012 [Petrolisthes cinctipes]|uniref:Beta-galactoside alpha-2,6-sialyltransferase 1 n=1 Tax=Petrolisthes cinctipes TaxID=88211 RepID=A0AAE1FXQ6_PETCI|nr:hypothetical protein Pcinc_014012 [Petrolisthes cinctipes]
MRLVGLSVWLFLNLVVLGMCSYLYLLWVQYWHYAQAAKLQSLQEQDETEVIETRPGKPRFHYRHPRPPATTGSTVSPTPTPAQNLTTVAPLSRAELLKAVERHKNEIFVQLRRSQKTRSSVLTKYDDRYGVEAGGGRHEGRIREVTRDQLLCALRKASIRTLRDGDQPFTDLKIAKYFPSTELLEGRFFNTCAVVSSSAALRGSKLGYFIDSHDAVVRFNHAPTLGYVSDVGSRTTLRIVNSQVVTKPEYNFWGSPLYSDVALLLWDPSKYHGSLDEWYKKPDFDLFPVYFRRRLMLPQEDLYLLHPNSLWNIWDILQQHSPYARLVPHPPSSGFLGIVLMLAHCERVNAMEFIPSLRVTPRCHYWDAYNDTSCTFGGWHPEDSEKLATLKLNTAEDLDTYQQGFVSIPGFSSITCPPPPNS